MRDKVILFVIIIAIVLVLIGVIAGMSISNLNHDKEVNNTSVSNVTNNTTINNTTSDVNSTENSTTQKSSSTSKKSGSNKKSGSSSDTFNGEKVVERHNMAGDPNIEYIGTKDNIYLKNKKTGKTAKRYLEDGVYYYK